MIDQYKVYLDANEYVSTFRYFAAEGKLQIMNVNQTDQGTYTCIARTHLDQDNASAVLIVLGKNMHYMMSHYSIHSI